MSLSVKDGDAAPRTLKSVTDAASQHLVCHQSEDGQSAALNVTAATAVKASAGRVYRVNVLVAGSAAGALHDCATTGEAAASNQIAVIPQAVGVYVFNWPCATGIVLVPGSGQTLAISYS